ncbi:MAG: DUF512 domain-containing protein [Gemmatimonadota bacterium]|nr:DUF512 domain-containing protein [Gemmatimonadota bacterium]
MVRIAQIEAGSIAEALELRIGTRVVRINGQRVRDGIDLTFLLADTDLEIETLTPEGDEELYEIQRSPGEPLGIVPQPDTVRECANKCVFCFIDGNPPGVRDALWLRDDDFRLSFTYGSYVTLTNLGPKGFQRLVDQRISPLYVSVHATEPDVRERLLVNARAGEILDRLRTLTEAGLEVHTQVVLCPEWNDGIHLERTIEDLWALGPRVRTLSVVPVGLTRYNLDRPVRLLRPDEAATAVAQVERARARAHAQRGTGWAYAADEMFLTAGQPLPARAYYDDLELIENGVGAVRHLVDELDAGLARLPELRGRRLRIFTGTSMAPFFESRRAALASRTGAAVEVHAVVNRFFGETVTIAGLMAGQDLLDAASDPRPEDVILCPAEALNGDGLFIDSVPFAEVARRLAPARVVAAKSLTRALHGL